MNTTPRLFRKLLLGASVVTLANFANAQWIGSGVSTGTGGTVFTDSANWTGGNFTGSFANVDTVGSYTYTLASNQTLTGALNLAGGSAAGGYNYTLSSSSTGTARYLTLGGSITLQNKATVASTFTTSSDVTIGLGSASRTISSGTLGTGASSTATFNGGIDLNLRTLSIGAGGAVTINGVVTGGAGANTGKIRYGDVTGSSTLTLTNAANTFAGGIETGGWAGLTANSTTVLANTGSNSALGSGGTIQLNNTTLRLQGFTDAQTTNRTFNAGNANARILNDGGNTVSLTGSITNNTANGTLTLGGSYTGGVNVVSGLVSNGSSTLGLGKQDAGTWRLTNAANSFTGAIAITGGTLEFTSIANSSINSALGAGTALSFNNGGISFVGSTSQSSDRAISWNASGGSATQAAIAANGSGAATLTLSGTFTASGTGTTARNLNLQGANTGLNTISSVIGNGSFNTILNKREAGTWVLSGINTYSGATTVFGGKLTIDSGGTINNSASVSIQGGNFNYNSATALTPSISFSGTGGTLSGSGTVGAFTLTSGNTISPGNSPGTITTGAQVWNGGATYVWEINNATGTQGTDWDFISSTGSLNISALTSSSKFNINVVGLTAGNVSGSVTNWVDGDASWKIASFTSMVGTFNSNQFNVDASGFTNNNAAAGVFSITNTGNDLFLSYSAIPEPSTYAAFVGAAFLGLALYRRRRSA